ncbi:MAG TPA: nucleotidyltransferase domain-containing protein [Longimicrobium sp.]|nr:nucleotidyltransferase domain-containing protein [Longimicrobium sp.]
MMKTRRRTSSLTSIFPSPAMARLVVFFAVRPGGRFHLRELMRLARLPSASLQAELRRLTEMGALRRQEDRGRAIFAADEAHPAWRGWLLLLRSCARPADVLREALVDAPGVEAAFVFGSAARGDMRPDSDVDLFLVGSRDAQAHAGRVLSEAETLLGRSVDVVPYEPGELAGRLRAGNAFVQRVLAGPREWVCGDVGSLQAMEAA